MSMPMQVVQHTIFAGGLAALLYVVAVVGATLVALLARTLERRRDAREVLQILLRRFRQYG
jgi:hypothetical protein